ncbi:MAG: C45 family peptidase [Pseudomonadota bacterium]
MRSLNQTGAGTLFESNTFLIAVLEGSWHDMGVQYGTLMVEHMQTTWDVLAKAGVETGEISQQDRTAWADRAYTTCTTRMRQFFDGVVEGSGWSREQVCFLDSLMEYGIYQEKLHSFAGCTSIMSWGSHSADGNMYIGRNLDWTETFNHFPQVLTVYKPTDGSYKSAAMGWPGIYIALTTINEHGVYFDNHDGTSMGGSVVFTDRAPSGCFIVDLMSDVASLEALIARFNSMTLSTSSIAAVADGSRGASIECSSLAGNRLRPATGDSYVVVNTFLDPSWGAGKRETVSNSLRRYANMTDRLAENEGTTDAATVRDLMDLRLFNEDGSFAERGGSTKPTNQDADLTNHQMVTDIADRKIWLKVPVPEYFADWTEVDLRELWASS